MKARSTSKSKAVAETESKPSRVPVPVKEFHLHKGQHGDEMVAYCLITQTTEGKELFPLTTENPKIRFIEGNPLLSDGEWDTFGFVPLGCGGGRFDEHKGETGRLPGECTSTLVADYLGIRDRREYNRLIEETEFADNNRGCPPTRLASLIQIAHRLMPNNPMGVFNWAAYIIDAIIIRERFTYCATPHEKTLLQIFEALKKRYKDPEALAYMTKEVQRSAREDRVTELGYIVGALYRREMADKDVIEYVQFILDGMYQDQIAFRTEVARQEAEIAKQAAAGLSASVEISNDLRSRRGRLLKLAVVYSDSPHASRAARYLGADIVLVRNSAGNVQIAIDNRIPGLSLNMAVRMIRWLELPEEAKGSVAWHDLDNAGYLDAVPHWYYFRQAEQMLNGSLTHAAVSTQMGMTAIVQALQHAFHWEGIKSWCSMRGIWMSSKKPRPEGMKSIEGRKAPRNKGRRQRHVEPASPINTVAGVIEAAVAKKKAATKAQAKTEVKAGAKAKGKTKAKPVKSSVKKTAELVTVS